MAYFAYLFYYFLLPGDDFFINLLFFIFEFGWLSSSFLAC